jgi:hypothetical protein
VGGVVFVLLGEAGTSEQCKSQASRHGDEPWKHRTPPPWHHHAYTQTLKEALQAVVKRFCRLFFDGILYEVYEGSSNMFREHHRKHARCHETSWRTL